MAYCLLPFGDVVAQMVVHQPAEAVAPGSTTASFTVNNPKDIYKYEYISNCKVFKNLAYIARLKSITQTYTL